MLEDQLAAYAPAVASTAPTARTRVRRAPKRGVYDRARIDTSLDEALVARVGFVDDDRPFVIPTLRARVGDEGCSTSRPPAAGDAARDPKLPAGTPVPDGLAAWHPERRRPASSTDRSTG